VTAGQRVSNVRSITEKRRIIKRTSSDSGIPQGVATLTGHYRVQD
jgi:hypothetical protein